MSNNSISNKRKKRGKKKLVVFILLFLIIAVGAGIIVKKKTKPKSIKGSTVKVEYGGVIDRLTETGTIELVRSVEIKSKISGKVKKLLVNEGENITVNQTLAIIEPDPTLAITLYAKRAAVEQTKIRCQEAKKELDRQKTLFERNLIPQQELEKSENTYNLSLNNYNQAVLEQQIFEMDMADASSKKNLGNELNPDKFTELDDYSIISPITGVVIAREVEMGEMIVSGVSAYGGGTILFKIGDPSEMIVKSSISEVDIGQLKVGQDVKIVADSYPEYEYRGRIKHIAPVGSIKQGTNIVTFSVETEILNPDERLRQGMSCDIDIIFGRRDSVLVLPVEAVFEVMLKDAEGEETTQVDSIVAYKWENDKFNEAKIKIGLESSNKIEIISGLQEGDEVSMEAEKKFKDIHKKKKADNKPVLDK